MIEQELQKILATIGQDANVPKQTGNLINSIKYRATETGFRIYIDEEQAPYAIDLEDPFWRRVFMTISHRLAASLGVQGYFRGD